MGGVARTVKKGVKGVTKGFQRSIDYAIRPDKLVKDVAHNPLAAIAKAGGMDIIFGHNMQVSSQGQRANYASDTGDDMPSQDRARMLTRQGAQGANPIMLLGQDFKASPLDKDEELGGERR